MKSAGILFIACLLFGWQAGPARAADDAPGTPPPDAAALGNDISWPQCGTDLPKPAEFAVIGVNGGRPETTNPCLVSQLAWAAGTAGAAAGTPVPLYVNTADPGPDGSWWWPTSNTDRSIDLTNPYGICDGAATAACAYVYGYAMAFDDVNTRGVPDPGHHLWWLDVETGNSWSSDTASNAAALEGMTAYLQGIGAEVGLYSTTYQFGKIAGTVGPGSNLNRLKDWIPGAAASWQANCASSPLTPGGTVALTQFTAGDLDYNYPCPTVVPNPPAPAPEQVPSPAQTQTQTTEQAPRPAYGPQPISYSTSRTNMSFPRPGVAFQ